MNLGNKNGEINGTKTCGPREKQYEMGKINHQINPPFYSDIANERTNEWSANANERGGPRFSKCQSQGPSPD
jgi:hypothetical protein